MHCLFYRLSSGTRAARLHTYAWKCVSNLWVPIITIAGNIQDHLSDTAFNVFDWESADTSVIRSVSLGRWSFEELRQIYHDLPTFRQMYVIRKDWWSNGNYEGRFCHEASPFGHADANADHEGSNHIATRFLGCCFFMFFHLFSTWTSATLQRPSPLVLLHLDCVCGAQAAGSRNFLSACHDLLRVDLPHIHTKTSQHSRFLPLNRDFPVLWTWLHFLRKLCVICLCARVNSKVNSFWAILELVKPIKLAQARGRCWYVHIFAHHFMPSLQSLQAKPAFRLLRSIKCVKWVKCIKCGNRFRCQVSTLEPFYLLREGDHDKEAVSISSACAQHLSAPNSSDEDIWRLRRHMKTMKTKCHVYNSDMQCTRLQWLQLSQVFGRFWKCVWLCVWPWHFLGTCRSLVAS